MEYIPIIMVLVFLPEACPPFCSPMLFSDVVNSGVSVVYDTDVGLTAGSFLWSGCEVCLSVPMLLIFATEKV